MRRLPPLNALRSFDAAARCLSFSAAAEELCVTHGAVSHQIRQLEDWLGQPLFTRHADGVKVTEAGQRLQQTTAQALDMLEARCAEIAHHPQATELTLGAPGSFLANWLIPRLEHFEARHPNIRLRLQTGADLAELASRRVDALVISGHAPWPREIQATPLLAEAVGPVCAPTWPNIPTTASALQGQTLLHTASRKEAWADWARAQHIDPAHLTTGRHFDHLPLMLEAAASGLGIGIAPQLLVERDIAQGRLLAPLGFVPCGAYFTLCIATRRANEAALQTLHQWLLEAALTSAS
ncbi:LysR substrate-binding domain-containing protein [Uliginosibacterium gangwonense]|uniref:LysR substrate-binding domain-containing protein n=1 Tax=Uliginosibacterium gangwonense TaxID=392736 RepID=UPI000374A3DC|nr:LysR substrate-binding domain-containing protein [Uliginosibacterium gangwonense]